MNSRVRLAYVIISALVLILAACAPSGTGDQTPGAEGSLVGTRWQLQSIGLAGAETPVVGSAPPTLEFGADGQAAGEGGCNSYGAQYQVQGNTISFSEIIHTEKACEDTQLMEQEQQFFDALAAAESFVLEGDTLTISYNGGQGALVFTRASS